MVTCPKTGRISPSFARFLQAWSNKRSARYCLLDHPFIFGTTFVNFNYFCIIFLLVRQHIGHVAANARIITEQPLHASSDFAPRGHKKKGHPLGAPLQHDFSTSHLSTVQATSSAASRLRRSPLPPARLPRPGRISPARSLPRGGPDRASRRSPKPVSSGRGHT